jgi:hypothetical protein
MEKLTHSGSAQAPSAADKLFCLFNSVQNTFKAL